MRKTPCNLCRVLLAYLLPVVFLLTGCHGARSQAAFVMPDSFDTSRDFEITFWAKNDTNKTQTAIYQKAIQDFEALYPNVHVKMRLYTDYGKIYNDVITNIATGTTPNVCISYPDHIATYLSGVNTVLPLDSLATDGNYGLGGSMLEFSSPMLDEIVPQFLEECRIGEELYALPFMRSTEACYVNKTYVESLGYELPEILTWDYVWEVAEAASKKAEDGTYFVNGQKVMIPFIYKSTDNMMIQMLKQRDGAYSTESGEIRIFNDTTRDILREIVPHVKSGAFSTFKISSYPANFLNAGQCIFAVDSTAGATWMGTDAPLLDISADKLVRFETAVRMVPQSDPDHPVMISQGPSVCIFNKQDPQEVLASWLFMQFLLSDSVQIAYAETEGYLPVSVKAQQSIEYQDYLKRSGEDNELHYEVKIAASQLLMKNTENTFVTPVFNGSASLRDAAGQMIENTVKSVRRKEVVDENYFDRLFEDVSSLYRLDQNDIRSGGTGQRDLGPLPDTSKALLISLALVWVVLALCWSIDRIQHRKKK